MSVDCRDGEWWFARHMSTNIQGYIPNNYVAAVNAIEQNELVDCFFIYYLFRYYLFIYFFIANVIHTVHVA